MKSKPEYNTLAFFPFHNFFIRTQANPVLKVSQVLEFFSSKSFLNSFSFQGDLKNVKRDRACKNYYNDAINFDANFTHEISKLANEITEIPRAVNKVLS